MEGRFVGKGDQLVLDRETGLLWHRQASTERMIWKGGFAYIDSLNQSNFAGFSDWRYPTKEELGGLILKEENRQTGLYLDALFGTQTYCWTSSEAGHHKACYVDFYYGDVYIIEDNYANHFIRAVRTFQG